MEKRVASNIHIDFFATTTGRKNGIAGCMIGFPMSIHHWKCCDLEVYI